MRRGLVDRTLEHATRGCKLAALAVSIADRDPQLQQLIRAAFELGVDAPLRSRKAV